MKTVPQLPRLPADTLSLCKETSLTLADGRCFSVQLPIIEGQKPSVVKLRVVAHIGAQQPVFSWHDVVAAMMDGAQLELGQHADIKLSPEDILQLDEAGWWLLMKSGVVPTGWVD